MLGVLLRKRKCQRVNRNSHRENEKHRSKERLNLAMMVEVYRRLWREGLYGV